jgi:hypothetical protein
MNEICDDDDAQTDGTSTPRIAEKVRRLPSSPIDLLSIVSLPLEQDCLVSMANDCNILDSEIQFSDSRDGDNPDELRDDWNDPTFQSTTTTIRWCLTIGRRPQSQG